MKTRILPFVLLGLLAACAVKQVHLGPPTPGCVPALRNGRAGYVCKACALCPAGERCWLDSDATLRCPRN